jgi:excinuclease ABC subunit B
MKHPIQGSDMAYAQTDKRELADAAYLSNPAPDVRTREKMEGGRAFVLKTEFEPAGDQPKAIVELAGGLRNGERDQVLLKRSARQSSLPRTRR